MLKLALKIPCIPIPETQSNLFDSEGRVFQLLRRKAESLPLYIFPDRNAEATSKEPGEARPGNPNSQLSTGLLNIPTNLGVLIVHEPLEPRDAPVCIIGRFHYLDEPLIYERTDSP